MTATLTPPTLADVDTAGPPPLRRLDDHGFSAEATYLMGVVPMCESVRACLFGQMVKRATPIVQHYHGDLYHDAVIMERDLTGPAVMYWAARPCGTHLAIDPADPAKTVGLWHAGNGPGGPDDEVIYRVDLVCREHTYDGYTPKDPVEGSWYVTFTLLNPITLEAR